MLELKLCSHLWDLATPFEAKSITLVPGVLAASPHVHTGNVDSGLHRWIVESALGNSQSYTSCRVDVARWKIRSVSDLNLPFSTERTGLIKMKYATVDLGCLTVEQL